MKQEAIKHKVCNKCKLKKDISLFYTFTTKGRSYIRGECKVCSGKDEAIRKLRSRKEVDKNVKLNDTSKKAHSIDELVDAKELLIKLYKNQRINLSTAELIAWSEMVRLISVVINPSLLLTDRNDLASQREA